MPSINRIGDPISCGDTVGHGSSNVFVNNIAVTRVQADLTNGHSCWVPTLLASGSSTVFANNIAVVTVGSAIVPHCCPSDCSDTLHSGTTVSGSPNVFADS